MMDNPRITLAIFGNQNSNSGFQPLCWINNPVQQLENLIPPGMEDNSYFFVLETGEKFTQYTLVQNHVSSYMSVRPGALKMAIGIPNGYRLADDESPLSLLMDVHDTFLQECMTQKSSLSENRNFKEELPDEQIFKDIVARYSLEPSYDPVYPMHGDADAVLLLSAGQMADFFRNVHYPELQGYKRVVIGEKGNTAVYSAVVSGLQIPLPMTPPPAPPKPQPKPQPQPQPQPQSAPRPQATQSAPSTPKSQYAPVVKSPSVPLPELPQERVYMDVGEKPSTVGSILGPIIKFFVVPLAAFFFGLAITGIASIFYNKQDAPAPSEEPVVENTESPAPTPQIQPEDEVITAGEAMEEDEAAATEESTEVATEQPVTQQEQPVTQQEPVVEKKQPATQPVKRVTHAKPVKKADTTTGNPVEER